jgi:hypothetical protein
MMTFFMRAQGVAVLAAMIIHLFIGETFTFFFVAVATLSLVGIALLRREME